MKAVLLGIATGMAVAIVAVGALGWRLTERQLKVAREGWNLKPILVAAEDLPRGSKVSFMVIAQRPMPEQFVTTSLITPDSASSIVGKTLEMPLNAGDAVKWAHFARMPPADLLRDCGKAVLPRT